MKNVLWLASWYPNRLEPLSGDFIERHAKAVSLNNSVYVIHVLRDSLNATAGKIFRETRTYNANCIAAIIYYKVMFKRILWLSKLISGVIFMRQFIRETKTYIAQKGKPDLVHVHVSQNAGLVALYLKLFYKLPYVITEHWSGFCAGAIPNFDQQHLLNKLLWKLIMMQSSGCSTVSNYLGSALKSRIKKLDYCVIPNVVDTTIFNYGIFNKRDSFRFIHISSLSYPKNVTQIFEAVRILTSMTTRKFELVIYGPCNSAMINLAAELNIQELIVFHDEVSQPALADAMHRSDALILYSLYETFGCVVIEANACGLPVLVSDIPTFREKISDKKNGIFAPLGNPGKLAEALLWMMENRQQFNDQAISVTAQNSYNFKSVSDQFEVFYNKALSKYLSSQGFKR